MWGQIRGYPSWPGKVVHESEVRGHPDSEDGKVCVHLLSLSVAQSLMYSAAASNSSFMLLSHFLYSIFGFPDCCLCTDLLVAGSV